MDISDWVINDEIYNDLFNSEIREQVRDIYIKAYFLN